MEQNTKQMHDPEQISSGCYVIDKDYTVVSVNETARNIYPQLKVGKKCYTCLLGLDSPCGPCPVAAGKKGPYTYTDPIRNIAETVDAVDVELEGHGPCHAMIFTTVGPLANFAATLPTEATELQNLALIKALTLDYYDVFTVHLDSDRITLYRHNGQSVPSESVYRKIISYKEGIADYIDRYVIKEDKDLMKEMNQLSYIREQLRMSESMTIHYRVRFKDELHHYYRRIVRIGAADSFEDIVVGVACEDEMVERQKQSQTLQQNLQEVECDSRTGLYTKEAFLIRGEELLRRYPKLDFDFCISRIENLGMINHQYGRAAGDYCLELMGRELKMYDDEHTCLTYLGDGTFASFTLNEPDHIRKAKVNAFRDKMLEKSRIKSLSLKWAIYIAPRREQSVEEIIDKTLYALATIRTNSHEDYVEYDQSMIDRMEWETWLANNFTDILKRQEFVAWYQPKYAIRTGKIVGAEALVRWVNKDGQIIAPSEFIPVLENHGLIHLLDAFVFEQVCRFKQELKALGFGEIPISVNLSRASMFEEHIAEDYAGIAGTYGVSPRQLPIEITESAAVRALSITKFADEFIERDFPLHMDDFGSGYSSLASLQVIPFDCIKLDKTLVDYIGRENSENLLKHTIAFAKESGKSVVAEGVENYEQYMFLKIAGCDMIQGYYFSRPVEKDVFIEMLKES